MPTQVVVVEDDPLFCELIVSFINMSRGFCCRQTFASGEEALRDIPANPPGLILVDIDLPGISGVACTARLKHLLPEIPLLIITGHSGSEHIFQALKAGANGYLLKQTVAKKLHEAMVEVMHGGAPMTGEIAAKVIATFRAKPVRLAPPMEEILSEREQQVLEKLAQGLAAKQIADELGVGFETARTYIRRIYAKLHTRSRGETVAKYFQLQKN